MLIGIIQSSFVPWRGYFDFIDDVDLFVFLDSVHYTRRDWRNRNLFKVAQGPVWVTIPVKYVSRGEVIHNICIDYGQRWIDKITGLLDASYNRALYIEHYRDKFLDILNNRHEKLSELNVALTHWIMSELGINTRTCMSMDYEPVGSKSELLLDIIKKAGATHYLSGPSAKDYLDVNAFAREKISLSFKKYDYPEYPQLYPPFDGHVTVLDLLFNCGPDARSFLKSRTANEVILP